MTAGVIGFLAYLAAVPIVLRLSRREPATLVAGVATAVWLVTLMVGGANFWALSITYWFLVFCFLTAFGAIYKSVSLRIIAALPTPASEVLERSYAERLALIVERGYAERRDERYALTAKGERIAGRVRTLQRIFRIERSG